MPAAPQSKAFWRVFNAMAALNVRLYRATGGRIGGSMSGARIVLVHHTGAKSGKQRVSPLMGLVEGDRVTVVASKGGNDHHPGWYHNLVAHPDTRIEIEKDTRDVRARVVNGAERDELWPRLVAFFPDFAVYEQNTARELPVIALEPR